MTAIAVICGAGAGLGLFLVLAGWRGWRLHSHQLVIHRAVVERLTLRVALCIGLGLLTLAFTRWPVAGALAGLGGFAGPALFAGKTESRSMIERTEAIANWTEMLRDTMAASAGIEGAIGATAIAAPTAIRHEVENLAARAQRGSLSVALRSFADELAHPTGDLVVSALILASERQARQLGTLLGTLAQAARDDATMRLRVEAGRARTRTSVRVVVISTLAMALGMLILNRDYLDPYNSALGQMMLLAVGSCFIGAFWWMHAMAAVKAPERIIAPVEVWR